MMKSLILLTVASIFATSSVWSDDTASKNKKSQGAGKVRTEASVRDLNKSPEKFAGQEVMVNGKIDRLEGTDAFVLDGPGLINDDILVIVDTQQQAGGSDQQAGTVAPTIKEKQKVQLTGKVMEMGVTEIEETYKAGLRPEVRAELRGTVMPVLVVPPNGIKVQG